MRVRADGVVRDKTTATAALWKIITRQVRVTDSRRSSRHYYQRCSDRFRGIRRTRTTTKRSDSLSFGYNSKRSVTDENRVRRSDTANFFGTWLWSIVNSYLKAAINRYIFKNDPEWSSAVWFIKARKKRGSLAYVSSIFLKSFYCAFVNYWKKWPLWSTMYVRFPIDL